MHHFNLFCSEFRLLTKHCQKHPNTMKHTKTGVYCPIGCIGCIRCENFHCDFMPRTCALILPLQPTLHRVSCSNETIQNAPKHYKTHQYMSLGFNGGLGAFCCEKLRCDFMAQTCALIAPLQSVLHRVSCCNEILPNAPKHYETQQNKSLGSNWVDQLCSLQKSLT